MRLNTVLKVLGLSAALAMPFALVGCDDDDEKKTPDAAPLDGSADANGNSDVAPKTDTVTGSDAKPADATTTVDAIGDATNAG